MSESTKYAPGELALLTFVEAWDAHCKQHKLAWPAPKIVVEDGVAIARFQEQRVSVRHCWAPVGEFAAALVWCTNEAEARWLPVAFFELNADDFCTRLASVLDRRIPW